MNTSIQTLIFRMLVQEHGVPITVAAQGFPPDASLELTDTAELKQQHFSPIVQFYVDAFLTKEVDVSAAEQEVQVSLSKGSQPKWDVNGMWVKEDFFGYEGLAEDIVSRLLERIENVSFVPYASVSIKRNYRAHVCGCWSPNFLPEGCEYRPLYKLLNLWVPGFKLPENPLEAIQLVVSLIQENCGLNITEYLAANLYLDAITLNEDRHLNNLGLFYDGTYSVPPIFDNGLSCLSDERTYGNLRLFEAVKAVRSKPFSRHFEKQVAALQKLTDFKLKLDRQKALELVDTYTNPLYSQEQVSRACAVLRRGLNTWEGILYEV